MTFTILDSAAVKELFSRLRRKDVLEMAQDLSDTLQNYSTSAERDFQPHRASVVRPDGQTTLFMPSTSPGSLATKIIGLPPPTPSGTTSDSATIKKPESVILLCDTQSRPLGILNAEETTAVRTALGSMLMYMRRQKTDKIVVFGAGKQALWHIRLALLLRGAEIKEVTVVNRTNQRSEELLQELIGQSPREWQSPAKFATLSFQDTQYRARLQSLLQDANAIFCTTPSTVPLFSASTFGSPDRRKELPYIAAIGSYKTDMQEIDPQLLRELTTNPSDKEAPGMSSGFILVDSVEGCLVEAGEIIMAGIPSDRLIEIGTFLGAPSSHHTNPGLDQWLETGFVVYKSVGMGVMDLMIGKFLIRQAVQKQIGITLGEL